MRRPFITALFVAAFMAGPVACTHDKPTPAPTTTRPPSSRPPTSPAPTTVAPSPSTPATSPAPSTAEPSSPTASD